MRILALVNHKGGVGKTTSAASIAVALSRLKQRVLLVDLDPQANLTHSLRSYAEEAINSGRVPTTYQILVNKAKPLPIALLPNLDLIPADLDLSGAELQLANELGRELVLRQALQKLPGKYDYILIDCPPSLGLLTLNVLCAVNEVYIPLQAHYLALHGITKLLEVIDVVKERKLNKSLSVGGVFITHYNERRLLNKHIAEADGLKQILKDRKTTLLKTRIRENIALAEAPARGIDIFSHQAKSHGAQDYLALAKEIHASKKTTTKKP